MRFWKKSETEVTASTVLVVVSKEILSLLPFFPSSSSHKREYGWMGNRMCRKVHVLHSVVTWYPFLFFCQFPFICCTSSSSLATVFFKKFDFFFLLSTGKYYDVRHGKVSDPQRPTDGGGIVALYMMDLRIATASGHKAVSTYPLSSIPSARVSSSTKPSSLGRNSINPFFSV